MRVEAAGGIDYVLKMSTAANHASVPAGWLESLGRSKAELAAGQTVPLMPVLDRLRASAERLEAVRGDVPGASETAAR